MYMYHLQALAAEAEKPSSPTSLGSDIAIISSPESDSASPRERGAVGASAVGHGVLHDEEEEEEGGGEHRHIVQQERFPQLDEDDDTAYLQSGVYPSSRTHMHIIPISFHVQGYPCQYRVACTGTLSLTLLPVSTSPTCNSSSVY